MIDTIIQGDCWQVAQSLSDESVNCIVTSPPYWGLRDYGVDGQFGLEKTPDEYIAKLVSLFTLLRPKLRKDGTLFVNLGDSYIGGKGQSGSRGSEYQEERNENGESLNTGYQTLGGAGLTRPSDDLRALRSNYLKPKDLALIPFRFALAMQAAGWWVRNVIIWAKPNPMPESVTDRCTTSHEYIFFFTRSVKYWCDMDAVRIELQESSIERANYGWNGVVVDDRELRSSPEPTDKMGERFAPANGRNLRSVWTFPTQPYPEAHFATFPEKLPETCILMGCPEKVCAVCGKPYERKIDKKPCTMNIRVRDAKKGVLDKKSGYDESATEEEIANYGKEEMGERTDLGIFPTCTCNSTTDSGIVLDPFMGSGCTGAVAKRLRRHFIGFELSEKYCELARKRIATTQQPMF